MEDVESKNEEKFVMEISKNESYKREQLLKEISDTIERFLFAHNVENVSSFNLFFEASLIEYSTITDIKKHKSIWDEG